MKRLKGSLRESLLRKSFLLPICQGDTVSPQLLQAQMCELESELTSTIEELALTKDAVTHTKEQLQNMELYLCQKYNHRCKLLAPHLVRDTASAFHRPHPTIAYFDVRIPLLMHLRLS